MASLPYLGVGLSYRWQLNTCLQRAPEGVDWLEITPEHFLPWSADTLRRLETQPSGAGRFGEALPNAIVRVT